MNEAVVLDFHLVPVLPHYSDYYRTLGSVDLSVVRYYLFPSLVTFRIGDTEFGLSNPIPVVDFAGCLLALSDRLLIGSDATFEFTEGEGEIFFSVQTPGVVSVRCDYRDGQAKVPALQLREEFLKFGGRVLEVIRRDFPELMENNEFTAWFLPMLRGNQRRTL